MSHATGTKYLKKGCLPLMWCPGCGHGIVLGNMLRAFEELGYKNNYVARGTVYHGWDLKNLIKDGLNKKGFSLVEVVSPCPTHFGRNNNMKVAVKMLNWLKEKGVPKETYDRLTDPQKDGYFVIGKLVDRDAPDFNTRYEEIRARAMGS